LSLAKERAREESYGPHPPWPYAHPAYCEKAKKWGHDWRRYDHGDDGLCHDCGAIRGGVFKDDE
jgi:hypothetical protein